MNVRIAVGTPVQKSWRRGTGRGSLATWFHAGVSHHPTYLVETAAPCKPILEFELGCLKNP